MVRGFWHDCAKKNFYVIKKFCPLKKLVNWRHWLGAVAPKEKEKKKKKEKEKRKKRKKRKKGTMDSVKLLHIKCCFPIFQ